MRAEYAVVFAYSRCKDNFRRPNGWLRKIPAPFADADLGAAVLEAATHSRDDMEVPEGPPDRPIIKSLGFKSRRAYLDRQISLDLIWNVDGKILDVTPTKNTGKGFEYLSPAIKLDLGQLSVEELGAAIRDAFKYSS
ncbi:hypothetical protein EH165_08080 [Nakamurella antarctica]|uniref:Uncharacterized protein n=1 Tax=Nakamurella antarctica TaxID=1902245 RepID=A0A3G8ZLG4_9ACTN|nr:hypothetical protein [Nakamurella antarctica]AZI58103.1 hypothetical protein EH165_08080 [Nakamurella antarctica]